MRLVDLVKIDNRFEKSVNLLLDLNDNQKINLYIPTRSSVKIIKEYLDEVDSFSGKRANILIGPYGKGKSHLLLVLLAILSGKESEEIRNLISRISDIDKDSTESIRNVYKKKRLLPVIVNTNSGNLEQAFVRSLSQALKREGLDDVVPDSYYSEALKKIDQWRSVYPETFNALEHTLDGITVQQLISALEQFEYSALTEYRRVYPLLTSGSEFNPFVDEEVISVYRSVNRTICEKHGYSGIYIIFDEFSKYVEGHTKEGFSADMKVLQDICELCNSSRDEQLHLTCVAHKAIRAYGDFLPKEIKNAFRGVEGRLTEIPFVVSSQNNYELIADAITKKPEFAAFAESKEFCTMLDESYQIPEFKALFNKTDFDEIIGKGAYPLTPMSSLLLLNLSEKVAQNERTIFTFLTSKDMYSLANFVEQAHGIPYAGSDLIYDYFSQLIEENRNSEVHNEWLKAEYALSKTNSRIEQAVIKSVAVIRMVNRADDVPATDMFLRLATGLSAEEYGNAKKRLLENEIIVLKKGTGAYDFQNSIGVNIDNEVADCAAKYFSKIDLPAVLNDVCLNRFILPKKYNQDHFMTRYFKIHFMSVESFMALPTVSYIKTENAPDGFLIVVLGSNSDDHTEITKHAEEMNDNAAVVGVLHAGKNLLEKGRILLAVRKLMGDQEFLKENNVLLPEVKNIEASLVNEINLWIEEGLERIREVYTSKGVVLIGAKGINRAVSDICESVYTITPIINHELINRHNVSAQISKARNIIVDDFLNGRLFDKYTSGTSAESTIYRAVVLHTKDDDHLRYIREKEILTFIHESKGRKNPFSKLVGRLTTEPYGVRKGILPILLAEQLMQLDDMPIIYQGKVERVIDAPLLSNVINRPEEYSLYVEEETAEKLEYIEGLEKLFAEYVEYCREIELRNRLSRLTCIMQSWYRALPQTSTTFREPDDESQLLNEVLDFRRLFIGTPNPRDLIFEQIPRVFKNNDLLEVLKKVRNTKDAIDGHVHSLKRKAEAVVRAKLDIPKREDFLLSLKDWYERIPDIAKSSVFSSDSQRLLNVIRDLSTHDNEEIVEKISKGATNFYIEDWTDTMIHEFENCFDVLVREIKEKSKKTDTSSQKITFGTEAGSRELFYEFNESDMSSTAQFFQNAVEDVLEDYGASLDNSEKIGVLMNIIKRIME